MQQELKDSVQQLCEALRNDAGYRETWKANIAMAFIDEYNRRATSRHNKEFIHLLANDAADRFLNMLTYQEQGNEIDLPGMLKYELVGRGILK